MPRVESLFQSLWVITARLFQVTSQTAETTMATSNEAYHLLDLPLEIRGMIWEYVLGPATYHIMQGKTADSLVYIRCLNTLKCDEHGSPLRDTTCFTAKASFGDIEPNDVRFFNLRGTSPFGRLGHAKTALMGTSRQIRDEATTVFWSTSCIEIFDARLVAKLGNHVEPRYLALLKTLRLHFPSKASFGADILHFFSSKTSALELRQALEKMTALKQLRIAIEDPGHIHPERRISMSGSDAVQLSTVTEILLQWDSVIAEDLKGTRPTKQPTHQSK